MAKRKLSLTPEDLTWMAAWYRDGYSTKQIAREWNCKSGSVHVRLQKLGVPMRPMSAKGKRGYTLHSSGCLCLACIHNAARAEKIDPDEGRHPGREPPEP